MRIPWSNLLDMNSIYHQYWVSPERILWYGGWEYMMPALNAKGCLYSGSFMRRTRRGSLLVHRSGTSAPFFLSVTSAEVPDQFCQQFAVRVTGRPLSPGPLSIIAQTVVLRTHRKLQQHMHVLICDQKSPRPSTAVNRLAPPLPSEIYTTQKGIRLQIRHILGYLKG